MNCNLSSCIRILLVLPLLAGQSAFAAENDQSPGAATTTIATAIPLVDESAGTDLQIDNDILQLFSLLMDAQATGMIDEAETLAKRIIELSIQSYGYDSRQTANALTDLGTVQTTNADFDAAILNFAAAIGIIERMDNRLSMDLIAPLKAMGTAQMSAGFPDQAMDNWNRAVHISHVNKGPHNYEQIETLVSIGRFYVQSDKQKKANKIRRRIAFLQERSEADASTFRIDTRQ